MALFLAVLPVVQPAAQDLPPGYGPQPKLPPPKEGRLPTVKWSVANEPWTRGQAPKAASGLQVVAFAQGLKHPRWLHVLPNGDVLVAEAATEPSRSWSPRALIQNWVQRRSGAIVESANRISLLRDTDGDGKADRQFVLLDGLRQPFGMALVGEHLYVANTDSVVRFPYRPGETRIADKGRKLLDLPVGHHWTRALLASADGTRLYATVGSGSNIGEKGLDIEKGRATIRDRLTQLAPIMLKNKYMLGEDFSMLDVALAPLLWRLDHYGIDLPKTAAPLMKYAERIFSRPAYIEALTPSEKVMRR